MLIEFSIENFRSIKNKVTLSMVATQDSSLENNLINTDVLKEDKLLRSVALYGANASGKTNVLFALNFLKALVTKSHTYQKGTGIKFTPFKFDKEYQAKPTKFEVTFIKNNIKYVYGISFNKDRIIDEYLCYYPNDKKALIFERKDTNKYNFTIDKSLQKFISERTLDNVLYLSKSTQEKYEKTSVAFDWFKDTLQVVGHTDHPALTDFTVKLLTKDQKLKDTILKALTVADLGIEDISASIKKLKIDDLPPDFPPEIKALMMKGKNEIEQTDIKIFHKMTNGKKVIPNTHLGFDEESEGTRRLFSLIGTWIDALSKGLILVVDELDTKLHHRLNKFLIRLFHDPTQNKKNAQLIFTTHNILLLEEENLFRRDQIWFTEKNPEFGSTDLYSLAEFGVRKDKNIKIGYITGRYGAFPFIKEDKIF